MGVERVAPYFTPGYVSHAASDNEARWVEIDLGAVKQIDAIKLLPPGQLWGECSVGFPQLFYIQVSNDSTFRQAWMYEDRRDLGAFPDPKDKVVTFDNATAHARYVRLTATLLSSQRLALTKIMVMSGGKDIAEGCRVTESNLGPDNHPEMLTRKARPMGEFVVTDNPGNVIPKAKWKPVKQLLHTPTSGITPRDGLFKRVMENNIGYLLHSFTYDDLVRNFKLKAGLPARELSRPEYRTSWWLRELPGSEAGRFLMGAGNTLRWLENESLRREMNAIVSLIDSCKEPDGYIMAYPKHKMLEGERGGYTRSWVTQGLIEAGYAGNEQAFRLLRGFYDWFDSCPFLPELMRRGRQGVQGMIPITRTYFTPVGRPEEIYTAQRYYQENYWINSLAAMRPEAIWKYPYDRPHNYLVTTLEAYMDLYLATGEERYMRAVEGAWRMIHDNWEHTGGSLAINEGTFLYGPKTYWLHKETGELCGNVFWVRLNQRFRHIRPSEEKYAGEIEQSIYNVIIPNQISDKGIRYFAALDGHKCYRNGEPNACMNTCCEGQGTRMYGSLPEYICSMADDGIAIDLYSAADIAYKAHGKAMKLSLETDFPYSPQVSITLTHVEAAETSRISLRIPQWAERGVKISVNGKKIGTGRAGTYFTISRRWQAGDKITFTLPATMRLDKYTGVEPGFESGHYCLRYGPVMMASVSTATGDSASQVSAINASARSLIGKLKPIAGRPLHFMVDGTPGVEVMPYFEVGDEAFSCYPLLLEEKGK